MARELTPKERMQIPKQVMPEQDPNKRNKNFEEVNLGYSEETAILEAERCLQCKKPKCIDGCPVDIKIDEFIDLIAKGEFLDAAKKIKEDNALPAICGRVCPQEEQCEQTCITGKKGDPVSIGRLERFVADYEMSQNVKQEKLKVTKKYKKVAIVGFGSLGGGSWYRSINNHPDFELKYIVDTNTELLEAKERSGAVEEDHALMRFDDIIDYGNVCI